MNEREDAPPPPEEAAGPFPESTLGREPEQPEQPPAAGGLWSGQPTPPPAAPTQVYGAVQPPAPAAPTEVYGVVQPGAPQAPGMASGDPLGTAYPPGYTSPPPPGAGGPAYAPPSGDVASPFGSAAVPGNYVLAGWWRRVGAQVIDGLIISIGALILMAPLGIGLFASADEGDDGGVIALIAGLVVAMIIITIVALAYAPLMMARTNGKTLGRMAVGTRVVRATGEPMTLSVAALREVAIKSLAVGIASSFTFGIAYLVDVLWPLWDDENRALHDFATNTRTILD